MKRVIIAIVLSLAALATYMVVRIANRPLSSTDVAKPMDLPRAAPPKIEDLSAVESIETEESKADYTKYLDELLPALSSTDGGVHNAGLDTLTSLPPQALPAVQAELNNSTLPKAIASALN